jgi:hypothetical protein
MKPIEKLENPDWTKMEDEFLHGIIIEGIETCMPMLKDLAAGYYIKNHMMRNKSLEAKWIQKRRKILEEIMGQKCEINESFSTENSVRIAEFLKLLNKEELTTKTDNEIDLEFTQEIIGLIVDSLFVTYLKLYSRDKSLSFSEIEDIVSNLHLFCLNEFTKFRQEVEE